MAISKNPPRRLVGVSTKMYFSASRTTSYVTSFLSQLSANPEFQEDVDIFIIPDLIMLTSVIRQLKDTRIMTGAQDCYSEDFGPFTGEVSAAVLAEVGTHIVELGHAERRRLFGETDAATAAKAAAVARNGMIPLVCFGEKTLGDYETSLSECSAQVAAVVAAVPDETEIILAYEPVWAIGAKQPAEPAHVIEVVKGLRALDMISKRKGTTRIVYGGSAGPGLFQKLKDHLDGLFLGRFAHDSAQFLTTIQEVAISGK